MTFTRNRVVKGKQVLAEIRNHRYYLFHGRSNDTKAQHVIQHRPVALPFAEQFGHNGIMCLTATLKIDDRITLILHLTDDTGSFVFQAGERVRIRCSGDLSSLASIWWTTSITLSTVHACRLRADFSAAMSINRLWIQRSESEAKTNWKIFLDNRWQKYVSRSNAPDHLNYLDQIRLRAELCHTLRGDT